MLTAVLLRRDILKLDDPALLNELVDPLLQCYTSSTSSNCKMQIGHCLAEVCSSLSMITGASSADAEVVMTKIVSMVVNPQDEISLKLLSSLADRAPVSFARVAVSSVPSLVSSANLSTPTTLTNITNVIVNGSIATTVETVSLVKTTPNLDDLIVDENSLSANLGVTCLLPTLGPMSTCTDEYAQLECLQSLGQAAITCPSLLAGNPNVLQSVLQMCLGLATNNNTNAPSVSLAALQVLASLVSVSDIRHRILTQDMARQMSETCIPICAQLMSSGIDDDSIQEWSSEPATLVEDGMEDSDNDEAFFAEALMESFLQNLAGTALNVAMPLVQQLLTSNDWKQARSGLAILEGGLIAAPVSLSPHIPDIVKAATSMASSNNPRVQYQAIRLLGALCETHSSVREMYGQIILQHVAALLNSPVSKVSSMACMTIVAYCRGKPNQADDLDVSQFLTPYLSDLMQALFQPLSLTQTDTGTITVRVRAMNAVACLAEASGEAFVPFYGQVMPGLLASIQLPQADIAGAAIQSLTIVGQAVGKEMFEGDAKQVLGWIVPVVSSAPSSSSFATEELLSACARIASVLEEDFAPYVEAVLPALYRQAEAPADISIVEGTEAGMQDNGQAEDMGDGTESMTVALPGRGFKRITINTTAIQEKAGNNRVMFELARALGATFGPYVETALKTFSPLVKFQYSSDVRSTAAQTLSALFDSACAYGIEMGDVSVARQYLPLLADTISEQISQEDPSDVEALYASADSLSEIFYIVFRNRTNPKGMEILRGLSMPLIEEVVKRCMQTMVSCLGRRANITKILGGNLTGEDEKEEYSAQLRTEDGLLTPLVDSVGYLLKFTKTEFVPIFEKYVVPVLGKYLVSTADVRASVASMCLFDDCVEYCGPDAATRYSPTLLQGIMVVMQDPSMYDRDFVQAAVYGISQMTRYGPSNILAPHLQTIVHQLMSLSQGTKEEAGDAAYLHEISVSALASLTLFGPFTDLKFVNRDNIMNIFLNNLPTRRR